MSSKYLETKQKMNDGRLYKDMLDELVEERNKAKVLQFKYNQTSPIDQEQKNALIQEMFAEITEPFWIEAPVRFSYGKHIHIGKNFYANFNFIIVDDAEVSIGDNVLVGPNVTLTTAGHPENMVDRIAGYQYSLPISIGNNTWIGSNVVVNPGVRIGENVIIGSGSIVTKDIPDNVVAFGVPCKVIRNIDEKR